MMSQNIVLWRSLGESNPCFSLERAKSIHLMIIAKRVRRWQTLSLCRLPPGTIDLGAAPGAPVPITLWRADRSTGSQKHRLKNRFSLAFSNGEAG